MCRIAGIIDSKIGKVQNLINVEAMCNAMAHGGPDDYGLTAIDENIVFGHRRLAIIDLTSSGHQPMFYDGLTISFNGEIYNYNELKIQLIELNYPFKTATDTEVILAGFKAWGINLFSKLEGMFAFALHDASLNETYLVRDQSGIKPLYYSSQDKRLIFSSEVKALQRTAYNLTEDKNWPVYFLAFGHIPHPYTTLKEVFSLAGGSYLKWKHQDNTYEIKPYAKTFSNESISNRLAAETAVNHQLKKAVTNHLISDAPIGVFLSGGIDSSILTLLANDVVGKNLNTLSINFVEAKYSEEHYQKLISNLTVGNHSSYRVTQADFEKNFEKILASIDQPTSDGINSWFVNKCAKENGLKAVLSGIGADELYGGYPSFKRMELIKKLKKIPKSLLRLARLIPSEKLTRIYYLSYQNIIGEYLFLRGFFVPAAIAKILGRSTEEVDALLTNIPFDKEAESLTGQKRASWLETNLFMKNQLLKDTDFMSMAHGVEVRVPFLDQDFLAATKSIVQRERFTTNPKGLLINAFKSILPEEIWNRPKMGFTFPLQEWFLKQGTITNESIYANHPEALNLIRAFKSGNIHWSKAYALYQVFHHDKLNK